MDALENATELMRLRGPDDSGVWISRDQRVGLGHRRLSILDLTFAGRQPLCLKGGKSRISFNGEIYNYQELRQELQDAGVVFHTRTDTEVVLAAYERWGAQCVTRFNGMWALAIWIPEAQELFLSRDRAGEKPLYYAHSRGEFAFASHLDALLEYPFAWKLNGEALNAYLHLGYVPGALSMVAPATRLQPGCNAIFSLQTGELKIHPYWTLPDALVSAPDSVDRNAESLEALLVQSVAKRLVADVPVGVFLSGGVDSSLVAAAASRVCGSNGVRTFTMAMPDKGMDESEAAQRIAHHLGTRHTVIPASPSSIDMLPELAAVCGEPLGDSSLLPTYLLSKAVREHVTVALGGDGGDELFGGYSHYVRELLFSGRWGWVPLSIWQVLGRAAFILPGGLRGRNRLASLRGGPLYAQCYGTPYFDAAWRKRLLAESFRDALSEGTMCPEAWRVGLQNGPSPLQGMTRRDFRSYLADDILVKVDRASMGKGLEVRCPWLDPAIIDFAFTRVPDSQKIAGNQRRIAQMQLADRLLPGLIDKTTKRGFSIPLFSWLRDRQCRRKMRTWIMDSPMAHLVSEPSVDKLFAGLAKGRRNESRIYALAMVALFLERCRSKVKVVS